MRQLMGMLLFVLSVPAWATSIALPTGGFAWVLPPEATIVGNVAGDYSASMPVIYALEFGAGTQYDYLFYRAGVTAYAATFSSWTLKGSVFTAQLTGTKITYAPGTWQITALTPFTGSVSEHLNLTPGCQGYACGGLGKGRLTIDNRQVVPEPATLGLVGGGLVMVAFMRRRLAHG